MSANRPPVYVTITIFLIALVQVALGLVFILAPQAFPSLLGLAPAPPWTDWLFAQFGARALGFACGMLLALRDVRRYASWLAVMIGVQVIDWLGTVLALAMDKVTLAQVSTAPYLPIVFVAVLILELRRNARFRSEIARVLTDRRPT